MRNLALFSLCFFLASCASTHKTPSQEKPLKEGQLPMELFFRNPVAKDLVVSPDGQMLASLQPFKGRMNVFVKNKDQMEWQNITKIDDRDIASLFWKNNQTLLFLKDDGGDENFHLYSVDVSGNDLRDLTPFNNVRAQIVDDLQGVSQDEVLVGLNKRNPQHFDVYRLNVRTGDLSLVVENPGTYTSYLVDHKGILKVAVGTNGADRTYFFRKDEKTPFKQILKLNFKDQITPIVFDKNNKNVFALSNVGRDT